jgi:hypothetical protein
VAVEAAVVAADNDHVLAVVAEADPLDEDLLVGSGDVRPAPTLGFLGGRARRARRRWS